MPHCSAQHLVYPFGDIDGASVGALAYPHQPIHNRCRRIALTTEVREQSEEQTAEQTSGSFDMGASCKFKWSKSSHGM
eukprot:3717575-Pyramimonas_sp.AAC.1